MGEINAEITEYKVMYPSDWDRHEAWVRPLRDAALVYLHEFWGERCPDYSPDCFCCQRWDLFDKLIENPFDKPES